MDLIVVDNPLTEFIKSQPQLNLYGADLSPYLACLNMELKGGCYIISPAHHVEQQFLDLAPTIVEGGYVDRVYPDIAIQDIRLIYVGFNDPELNGFIGYLIMHGSSYHEAFRTITELTQFFELFSTNVVVQGILAVTQSYPIISVQAKLLRNVGVPITSLFIKHGSMIYKILKRLGILKFKEDMPQDRYYKFNFIPLLFSDRYYSLKFPGIPG